MVQNFIKLIFKNKTLIEENARSGKYTPTFSNNTTHVASLSKSVMQHKAFLN